MNVDETNSWTTRIGDHDALAAKLRANGPDTIVRSVNRLEHPGMKTGRGAKNLPIFFPDSAGKQRITRKHAEVYWKQKKGFSL